MTAGEFDAVAFIAKHGIVLASANGPVPSLAEAVAGEPIRGSWWGHEKGGEIFQALGQADESPDVLCFRLVNSKLTFVHRRLWPALVRVMGALNAEQRNAIKQEHTESGSHRNLLTPFPKWVPEDVARTARGLSEAEATAQLGSWFELPSPKPPRRRKP